MKSRQSTPEISVIIPTYNRRGPLERLLSGLAMQSLPAEVFEVVVVVDGSTDGTGEMLASFQANYALRWKLQPNTGRAAARNAGMAMAGADLFLMLDDDMEPAEDLLAAHLQAHRNSCNLGVLGTAPVVVSDSSTPVVRYIAKKFIRLNAKLAKPGYRMHFKDFYSGNFSIRRALVENVGGFSEEFTRYGNEDSELALRLMKSGVRLEYRPEAVAYQHYLKPFCGLAEDTYEKGRTAVVLATKVTADDLSLTRLSEYRRGSASFWLIMDAATAIGRRAPVVSNVVNWFVSQVEAYVPRYAPLFYGAALNYFFWLGAKCEADDRGFQLANLHGLPAKHVPVPQCISDMRQVLEASVIICTRNRPALLEDTVASVGNGSVLPAEIIIVDQSDRPHTAGFRGIEGVHVQHIPMPAMGASHARNLGIASARYPMLVFLDDDVIARRDWLRHLIAVLQTAGPDIVVTGAVLDGSTATTFAPSTTSPEERAGVYEGRIGRDVLNSGNMAMHRATVQRVGVFDERLGPGTRFRAAEDNDYGFRILEAGLKIHFEPAAAIEHIGWRPRSHEFALYWGYGKGQGAFYCKHFASSSGYIRSRMYRAISRRLASLPANVFRLRRTALRDVAYLFGMTAGFIEWLTSFGRVDMRSSLGRTGQAN